MSTKKPDALGILMSKSPQGDNGSVLPGQITLDLSDTIKKAAPRSKHVQLLMPPELHAKVKAIADANGVSFNELLNVILERFVGENYSTL